MGYGNDDRLRQVRFKDRRNVDQFIAAILSLQIFKNCHPSVFKVPEKPLPLSYASH